MEFLENSIRGEAVEFYLGGYGEFDNFAYQCCEKYKKIHNNASLVFITPYLDGYSQEHNRTLSDLYDEIIYPEIEDKPLRFAIHYRNRWMVDKADILICGVNHKWGGAYKAYCYAKRRGKTIFNVMSEDM